MLNAYRTDLDTDQISPVDTLVAFEAIADYKGWSCTYAQGYVWSMVRRSPLGQLTFYVSDAEYRFERV